MADPIVFTVYGIAQPAGSKRALPAGGRPGARPIIVDANSKSRPWKQEVAGEAARTMQGQPLLDGPLALDIVFWLPRPKGHHGAKGVRPSAPRYPAVKPDTTKLLRAVEDALTGIVWRDDAQIVTQLARKRYADGDPVRTVITIGQATGSVALCHWAPLQDWTPEPERLPTAAA